MNNKTPTKFKLHGEDINLAEECRKRDLDYSVVYERIKDGYSVEEALSKPVRKKGRFEFEGKTYTLKELCIKKNWSYSLIANGMYFYKLSFEESVRDYLSRGIVTRSSNIISSEKSQKANTAPSKTSSKRTLKKDTAIIKIKTLKEPGKKLNAERILNVGREWKKILDEELIRLRQEKRMINQEHYGQTSKLLICEKSLKKELKKDFQCLQALNKLEMMVIQKRLRELNKILKK